MPDNPYDGLLREFQLAYAKYSDSTFGLIGVRYESKWSNTGPGDFAGAFSLGEQDGVRFNCTVYARAHPDEGDQNSLQEVNEALDRFLELACEAGAALPPIARAQIPYLAQTPYERWLSYLYGSDTSTAQGASRHADGELLMYWLQPFDASAEAIERTQLCSSDAMTPPERPTGDVSDGEPTVESTVIGDRSVQDSHSVETESQANEYARSVESKQIEWSVPMTKAEMARRITADPQARSRKVEALLGRFRIEHVSGRLHHVRLDLMDKETRRKMTRAT